MTEEYIMERLALFCNSSLMLSIDGSHKLPDFSWDLVILKTLVCQQPPLSGTLSLRLLWSKPTSSFPLGAFHSIHGGVSATTITSPLCSRRLCMSIVHSELFICIKVSVLSGVVDLRNVYVDVPEAKCLR